MPKIEDLLPKALAIGCRQPATAGMWASVLDPFAYLYGINTPKRIAAFIGQVSVESAGFTALEENLNYSAARMIQVWPSRFHPAALADECAYDPETLANVVYCNRMGNGDQDSGDGWRYRGAGLIQLTGKSNHMRFAVAANIPVETVGDYLRTPRGAAHSACWYWFDRELLNTLADGWFITAISRKINGGDGGLQERIALSNRILKAIGG